MAVKFLSEDYVEAAQHALNEHAGFAAAIVDVALSLQFHVTEGPDGDISYFVDIADATADVGLGEIDDADVTVTNSYETAVGISTGELNTQMAFMTGKLKVSGDMSKLMLNQASINEMARAMSAIDAEY